jgi:hypothetical protein
MKKAFLCLFICLFISQSASADYILSLDGGSILKRITDSGGTVWETTGLYNNIQPELVPGDDSFIYTVATFWGDGINQFDAITGALVGLVTFTKSWEHIYDVQWGADYNQDGIDDVWITSDDAWKTSTDDMFEVYDGITFGTVFPDTPLATWGVEDVEPCDGTGGCGLLFGPDLTGDGIGELYATKGYRGQNNNINIWDPTTMIKVATYPISEAHSIASIILGPDVNGDGREELWIVSSGTDEILAVDYMNGTNYGAVNLGVTVLESPSDVDYGPNGTILITTRYATSLDPDYAGDRTNGGNLIKYDPATGISMLVYEEDCDMGGVAYIPPTINMVPYPANGATDVPRDVILNWRPMTDYADSYNVYFGTDINDVNEANVTDSRNVLVRQNSSELTYAPPELLDYGQAYYWRIDDVNDTEPNSPLKGDVWNFTITDFFIVVEDFEDYSAYPPNEVWNTWIDGWYDPANGGTAGYPSPDDLEHYREDDIVHGGDWSLPLFYDNDFRHSSGYSEITRTFESDMRNWTRDGVVTLTLFYQGKPDNAAGPMYVAVDGVVYFNDDPSAALVTKWMRWDIPLQFFADRGVNLADVSTMSIGFGNKANPVDGGEGFVFFDDIRLYRPEQ